MNLIDLCLVPEERIHSGHEERRLGLDPSDTVRLLLLVYEWRSHPVSASAFPQAQSVQFAHTPPDRDSRCVVASHNLRGERVPSPPRWTALSPKSAKTSPDPALGLASFPMSRVSRSCDLPALDDMLVDFGPVRADDEHPILAVLGPKRLLDNNRNRLSQNTIFRNRVGKLWSIRQHVALRLVPS